MNSTRNQVRLSRFVATAVVLALIVVAALWWVFSGTGLDRATVLFSRAVGVYSGSDVRLLGVRIGQVESVTPRGEQVEVTLTYDGSAPVAADTDVVVIAPSVVADRYVQFSKPARGGPRLVDNATIGVDRSATPVELDELYASLDSLTKALGPDGANKNGALSDLLKTGARNLQGNGTAFNDSVKQLSELARTLAGNSRRPVHHRAGAAAVHQHAGRQRQPGAARSTSSSPRCRARCRPTATSWPRRCARSAARSPTSRGSSRTTAR